MRHGHPARLFLLEDVGIEGEPIFAGGIGLEEGFGQVGGPAGVAAFAVVVSEAEDGICGQLTESSRTCVKSRLLTGRNWDGRTVATATVLPVKVINSTS
jgi:hypothetical protein